MERIIIDNVAEFVQFVRELSSVIVNQIFVEECGS